MIENPLLIDGVSVFVLGNSGSKRFSIVFYHSKSWNSLLDTRHLKNTHEYGMDSQIDQPSLKFSYFYQK